MMIRKSERERACFVSAADFGVKDVVGDEVSVKLTLLVRLGMSDSRSDAERRLGLVSINTKRRTAEVFGEALESRSFPSGESSTAL